MSNNNRSAADSLEERGARGARRADDNYNLEEEALIALENSLVVKLGSKSLRNFRMIGSRKRVSAEIDKMCSMSLDHLSALQRRESVMDNVCQSIISERDQALQDLRNTELAFCDVHSKYERAKMIIENMKKNENLLVQRDEEMMQLINAREQKYQAYKQEAHITVEKMYMDLEAKVASIENDNTKLTAQLRRTELRAETAKSELRQKDKENDELNKLADELMGGGEKKFDPDDPLRWI
ncbi:unnamed protein product [Orchesella dallaii]|uniref:Transforming acidic coiled-coil-containing protein C-terminal domain-containing protein n=1 Tax=Orchesella dallaii TaxID=48710 RepID=A0ABP1R1T3_9HEXA